MASRDGAMVKGTDGSDYSHRETIVQQYYVSAQNKSRLKWSILIHVVLSSTLLVKLFPEVVEKLQSGLTIDVSLLKAVSWEWVWLVSCPVTVLGWNACKKSNASLMNKFILLLALFGFAPILLGVFNHFADFSEYLSTGSKANMATYQGYPVVVLWYSFFLLTSLLHFLQLYFARVLVNAWGPKRKSN